MFDNKMLSTLEFYQLVKFDKLISPNILVTNVQRGHNDKKDIFPFVVLVISFTAILPRKVARASKA